MFMANKEKHQINYIGIYFQHRSKYIITILLLTSHTHILYRAYTSHVTLWLLQHAQNVNYVKAILTVLHCAQHILTYKPNVSLSLFFYKEFGTSNLTQISVYIQPLQLARESEDSPRFSAGTRACRPTASLHTAAASLGRRRPSHTREQTEGTGVT